MAGRSRSLRRYRRGEILGQIAESYRLLQAHRERRHYEKNLLQRISAEGLLHGIQRRPQRCDAQSVLSEKQQKQRLSRPLEQRRLSPCSPHVRLSLPNVGIHPSCGMKSRHRAKKDLIKTPNRVTYDNNIMTTKIRKGA